MPIGKLFEYLPGISSGPAARTKLPITDHDSFMGRMFPAAVILVAACGFVPESSFELSNESRLPKWIVLRPGEARTAVTVTMDYYIGTGGGTAKFTLRDARGNSLGRWVGSIQGNQPHLLSKPPAGFPPGYPSYEIIHVGKLTEIVEHRKMEPAFYITDSPIVWEVLVGHR